MKKCNFIHHQNNLNSYLHQIYFVYQIYTFLIKLTSWLFTFPIHKILKIIFFHFYCEFCCLQNMKNVNVWQSKVNICVLITNNSMFFCCLFWFLFETVRIFFSTIVKICFGKLNPIFRYWTILFELEFYWIHCF